MKDQLKQVSYVSTAYTSYKTQTLDVDSNDKVVDKIHHLTKPPVQQKKEAYKTLIISDLNRLSPQALSSYKFRSISTQNRMMNPTKLIIKKPNKQTFTPSQALRQEKLKNQIYGSEWNEYLQIYEFHNLMQPNSLDILGAEKDLNFIKSKVQDKFRQPTIIQNNTKSVRSRTSQKEYVDEDGVYWVRPHRLKRSGLILKRDFSKNENKRTI